MEAAVDVDVDTTVAVDMVVAEEVAEEAVDMAEAGGRYGRRGHGHGGRGNGGAAKSFNGVDCTHVNRFFTQEEFDKMGDDGRIYVHNNRKRKNDGDGNHQSENKRLVQEISALRAKMRKE